MKIALLGYGKMGKEIETLAIAKGHEVVLKINEQNLGDLTLDNLRKADVAIEFSTPHTVVSNIRTCFEAGLPVVVGTTAWYGHFDMLKKECEEKGQSLFYATNFSIGVNLFFHFSKQLAKMMKHYAAYEVSVDEVHHTHKLDAPSGTAITTAEGILSEYPAKSSWVNQIVTTEQPVTDTTASSAELLIRSYRTDEVPGTHAVYYESEVDTIELRHTAHSRKGFAAGALAAAEWLPGKKGIFTMNDMLSF
jgi:4-hydroxy-tetrahydrodipicolinate reductase